jgi:hypothetical protein
MSNQNWLFIFTLYFHAFILLGNVVGYPGKPAPIPMKTHTCMHRQGFLRIQVKSLAGLVGTITRMGWTYRTVYYSHYTYLLFILYSMILWSLSHVDWCSIYWVIHNLLCQYIRAIIIACFERAIFITCINRIHIIMIFHYHLAFLLYQDWPSTLLNWHTQDPACGCTVSKPASTIYITWHTHNNDISLSPDDAGVLFVQAFIKKINSELAHTVPGRWWWRFETWHMAFYIIVIIWHTQNYNLYHPVFPLYQFLIIKFWPGIHRWLFQVMNRHSAYYAIFINRHTYNIWYLIYHLGSLYTDIYHYYFDLEFSKLAHAGSGVWLCWFVNQHPAFYAIFINMHTHDMWYLMNHPAFSLYRYLLISFAPAFSEPGHAGYDVWLCWFLNWHLTFYPIFINQHT